MNRGDRAPAAPVYPRAAAGVPHDAADRLSQHALRGSPRRRVRAVEAQRRADALAELTAAMKARDARMQELERTAEERLRALLETDAALRYERAVRES